MCKRMVLTLILVFGLPTLVGNIRANHVESEGALELKASSYMMGVSYKEAFEAGEIINCFSWKEDHTVFEIEVLPFK